MNRHEAAQLLTDGDSRSRLRAARWFAKHADPSDFELLRQALERDNDHWTQSAIQTAFNSLTQAAAEPASRSSPTGQEAANSLADEIYAEAVEETTAQLVHELEPVLGVLKVLARKDIPNYDKSETAVQISRLDRLLAAIDRLRRAAAPPRITELDLADVVRAEALRQANGATVEFAGPRPCLAFGDQALIELAVGNGVRNAIEAGLALGQGTTPPVVVTWGDTARDYWVSVLDEGVGIMPGRTTAAFEIGVTSKRDHLGMGLALAKQAVTSLRGEVSLQPRLPKGATYKFSWPKPNPR